MEERSRAEMRTLWGLLALNVAVHFFPFARPGFQPDDFFFLLRSRMEPGWTFAETSLSQATRPLGFFLFILIPRLFGLAEPTQLLVLLLSTTLFTALVYRLLADLLPRPLAGLSALAFVLWPVKHEIYATQLFGIHNLVGFLIAASALLYRRWLRNPRSWLLALSVAAYGLSVFTYEIGYLLPLVLLLMGGDRRRRLRGVAWFLIPASLYWVWRATQGHTPIGGGLYPVSLATLAGNLVTSLPSNLIGFQVARNIGYGFWGVVTGPLWFQIYCGLIAWIVASRVAQWFGETPVGGATSVRDHFKRIAVGLAAAVLLLVPAALVLVESRQSVLASVAMGVVVASFAALLKRGVAIALFLSLLLAAQGLALRQAEASQLQAAAFEALVQRRDDLRSASVVVIDLAGLAHRVPYTWGERHRNVLRAYWGIHAFSAAGFRRMVAAALPSEGATQGPLVRTCAVPLRVTEATVECGREMDGERSFTVTREGAVVVDLSSLTVP